MSIRIVYNIRFYLRLLNRSPEASYHVDGIIKIDWYSNQSICIMLFSLILALVAPFVNASVKDCASPGALFKLTSMSFLPDPPIKGQNSTLILSMNVPSEVVGGTVTYTPTYNFIPLSPTTESLCTNVPNGCPIRVGKLETVSSMPFDSSLSGTLMLKIEWKDLSNKQLMCVSVTAKV